MVTLNQYKHLFSHTKFQYEQARLLITDLTKQGILLPMGDEFTEPERLFFDSQNNYQSRKELYSMFRFRQHTLAFDIEFHVASLLGELDVKPETTQEAFDLIGQMVLETKPYVKQQYSDLGFAESELRPTEFNMVLMFQVRTIFSGWVLSSDEIVKIHALNEPDSNRFTDMFKEHVLTD